MSSAPSIGRIGSIEQDARSDRSKGWLAIANTSVDALRELLAEVARTETFGTRLNVRTMLGHRILDRDGLSPVQLRDALNGMSLGTWKGAPIVCEAVIPVANHETVGYLAYFGANLDSRGVDQREVDEVREMLDRLSKLSKSPVSTSLRIEMLPACPCDEDIADMLAIYTDRYTTYLVAFTDASVREMARNNHMAVVRDQSGRIASICVAEKVELPVEGHAAVVLAEISDAATRRDCEKQGMYTAAKATLIRWLRAQNPDMVITTEARANSASVVRSNLRLDLQLAGLQPCHCLISSQNNEDVRQRAKWGHLFVFYAL